MSALILRKGTDDDAELIISYLKKLAEYEKLTENCNITPEVLIRLMNEENGLNVIIAEKSGVPAGMMTYYFYKIATLSGKRIMYIEDVFIDEQLRGEGIGSRMFEEAKQIGREKDCAELRWKCLEWNTPAQDFYGKIGGKLSDNGWLNYTIDLRKG